MRLLLEYGANPDLLCEGHSALTLAICSGNDLVRYWYLLNMTIHICMCVLHVYITCKCSKFNQNWSYMYSTYSLNNECQFVQFGDLFFVIPIILETFVAVLVLLIAEFLLQFPKCVWWKFCWFLWQAVDTLLEHGANPSLRLSRGVGSALCAATSFMAERRRTPAGRIKLVSIFIFFFGEF